MREIRRRVSAASRLFLAVEAAGACELETDREETE
jgi:hypothetical protein